MHSQPIRLQKAYRGYTLPKSTILNTDLTPERRQAIQSKNSWNPSMNVPPVLRGFSPPSRVLQNNFQFPYDNKPEKMIEVELVKPTNTLISDNVFSKITLCPDVQNNSYKQIAHIATGFSPQRVADVLKKLNVIKNDPPPKRPASLPQQTKFQELTSEFLPHPKRISHFFPVSFEANRPLSVASVSLSRAYMKASNQVLTLAKALPEHAPGCELQQKQPPVLKQSTIDNKAVRRIEQTERKNAIARTAVTRILAQIHKQMGITATDQFAQLVMGAFHEDKLVTEQSTPDDECIRAITLLVEQGIIASLKAQLTKIAGQNLTERYQSEFLSIIKCTTLLAMVGPQLRDALVSTSFAHELGEILGGVLVTKRIPHNKGYFYDPVFWLSAAVLSRTNINFAVQLLKPLTTFLKNYAELLQMTKVTDPALTRLRKEYGDSFLDSESEEEQVIQPDYVDSRMRGILLNSLAKTQAYQEADGVRSVIQNKEVDQLRTKQNIQQHSKFNQFDVAVWASVCAAQVVYTLIQHIQYLQQESLSTDMMVELMQDDVKSVYNSIVLMRHLISTKRDGQKIEFCQNFDEHHNFLFSRLVVKVEQNPLMEKLLDYPKHIDEVVLDSIAKTIRELFE